MHTDPDHPQNEAEPSPYRLRIPAEQDSEVLASWAAANPEILARWAAAQNPHRSELSEAATDMASDFDLDPGGARQSIQLRPHHARPLE